MNSIVAPSANGRQPQVALVVCGKFHYFNYVPFLEQAGALSQFIFSHRVSGKGRLGGSARLRNLFIKEYLFQFHTRLLGDRLGNLLHPLYHWQWDRTAAAVLRPCDVLHFLMHGNCRAVITRARKFNAVCLGEAVNSYPDDYQAQIDQEYADLGLPGRPVRPRFVDRIKDEIPRVDRILVPSSFVEESYVKHGIRREKMIRLAYGANLQDFTPGPGGGSIFKVVCTGQVTLRKGHQYLLRAWKALNLPSAELHCCGFVDQRLIGRLQAIGAPNVIFHGSLPKAELVRRLQSADLFVFPTVEDGFGIAILEAMACGLPVIASTNCGAPDIMTDGREGRVVQARSVEALMRAIEESYRDQASARAMGMAGRALVENKYNWSNYASSLVEIYRTLLTEQVKTGRGGVM